ncbi:hypothetical protein FACS1894152_2180 [Bacilli bacterium]|nr:hypothetical protein FACS1894152_2180 [Bacilli bacterium]
MIIPIILTLIGFAFPHYWATRPVDSSGGSSSGKGTSHHQGFYNNGDNHGYFDNGVHSDSSSGYVRDGEHKRDHVMRAATHGMEKEFRGDNYAPGAHDCRHYRMEADKRYDHMANFLDNADRG